MFGSQYLAPLGLLGLTNTVLASPMFKPLGGGSSLLGTSFGVPGQNHTFDYVVVGGGMAGLALASRLAENPSLSIGVVEAGTFYEMSNGNNSEIPGLDIQNAGKDKDDWQPGNDWGFITAPQKASKLFHITPTHQTHIS
jgi:choline dehydrogenase